MYSILSTIYIGYRYKYIHTHNCVLIKSISRWQIMIETCLLHQQLLQERLLKAKSLQLSTKIYLPINKKNNFGPANELEHQRKS